MDDFIEPEPIERPLSPSITCWMPAETIINLESGDNAVQN